MDSTIILFLTPEGHCRPDAHPTPRRKTIRPTTIYVPITSGRHENKHPPSSTRYAGINSSRLSVPRTHINQCWSNDPTANRHDGSWTRVHGCTIDSICPMGAPDPLKTELTVVDSRHKGPGGSHLAEEREQDVFL